MSSEQEMGRRIDELRDRLLIARSELERLRAAIKAHHDQHADDRCWG